MSKHIFAFGWLPVVLWLRLDSYIIILRSSSLPVLIILRDYQMRCEMPTVMFVGSLDYIQTQASCSCLSVFKNIILQRTALKNMFLQFPACFLLVAKQIYHKRTKGLRSKNNNRLSVLYSKKVVPFLCYWLILFIIHTYFLYLKHLNHLHLTHISWYLRFGDFFFSRNS